METIGNGPTAGILNLAFDTMGWHSSFVVHGDDREQIPQWEQPLSRNLEPSTSKPRPYTLNTKFTPLNPKLRAVSHQETQGHVLQVLKSLAGCLVGIGLNYM